MRAGGTFKGVMKLAQSYTVAEARPEWQPWVRNHYPKLPNVFTWPTEMQWFGNVFSNGVTAGLEGPSSPDSDFQDTLTRAILCSGPK